MTLAKDALCAQVAFACGAEDPVEVDCRTDEAGMLPCNRKDICLVPLQLAYHHIPVKLQLGRLESWTSTQGASSH